MRAIVVDDRQNVIDVLSDILKSNNVDVIGQGQDGNEAVELYQKFKPDVVFLDVMMPIYDGFYGLQEIRKINPFSLIVFVTADPMLEAKMLDKVIIPSAVVHKPFDLNKISNVISCLKLTLSYSHDKMQHNLVKLCLEKLLLDIGHDVLNNVEKKLKSEFSMNFADCLDNPECLKKILKEEFSQIYEELINNLENAFTGFTSDRKIVNFLTVLES